MVEDETDWEAEFREQDLLERRNARLVATAFARACEEDAAANLYDIAHLVGDCDASGFVARMCRTSLGVPKGIDNKRFQPGALSCLSNIIPRDAVIFPGKGIG
jgi:hypothetical protein